jgi:hypothetical protein
MSSLLWEEKLNLESCRPTAMFQGEFAGSVCTQAERTVFALGFAGFLMGGRFGRFLVKQSSAAREAVDDPRRRGILAVDLVDEPKVWV